MDMLRLLDNPLPESDYLLLKQQIVNLLAKQLDDEMGALEKQNNWNEDTYQKWGNEHNRTGK